MELSAADFAGFFEAVHGYPPFPWQENLARGLAEHNEWPDVLSLPTSAGKTAALDAAVFHLALRADEPERAALRICLVVDRRLVVDDAHARARKIAATVAEPKRVAKGRQRAIVVEVAKRLATLSESPDRPVVVQRLRGGTPLEHEWVRTPTQPTILCSTVDQVGSRLLFRGYGVSDRMRPVHAGLLGENTLILVDEAHLSRPFLQTVRAVREFGGSSTRVVVLSATPGEKAERELALTARDRANEVLGRRLRANKPARLVRAGKANPADVLCKQATDLVARLEDQGVVSAAVAVVVNRVRLAREVFEGLSDAGVRKLLLIGRCRSIERDRLVSEELAPFRTGADRSGGSPLVVVATQCIEVGVDLDLDGLVTQAAPLDALRQRFGRLNRDGREIRAQAAIVATPEDLDRRRPDPVYGDRTRRTWDALDGIADEGMVDFGIDALAAKAIDDVQELAAPSSDAPVLMPAYLDLWARTSPPPASDPDVNLFLHGKDAGSADVSLVWRADMVAADVNTRAGEMALAELLAVVPPRSAEAVTVPVWAARSFLDGGARQPGDVADIADREGDDVLPEQGASQRRVALRWAGRDDSRTGAVSGTDVRAGDVLVLPAEYGGCDRFGWHPDDATSVYDIADLAMERYRGPRLAVRVSRDVVENEAEWEGVTRALVEGEPRRNPAALIDQLAAALPERDAGSPTAPNSARSRRDIGDLLRMVEGPLTVHRYGAGLWSAGGAVLIGRRRDLTDAGRGSEPPSTEDDDRSHGAAANVTLETHSTDVATTARAFAAALKMEHPVAEDIALAAYLHDAGKADRRFQAMLAGGDDWNMPEDEPLAKSARGTAAAWKRAGLPSRWRHEAQSVRMCRDLPRLAEANDPELVIWLVGTHHGLGRPFFGFVEDDGDPELLPCLGASSWASEGDGPQSLGFRFRGKAWPDLFDALQKRYGIWGLAHLEAVVRLADHRASEAGARR